jgi:hypothetical protein
MLRSASEGWQSGEWAMSGTMLKVTARFPFAVAMRKVTVYNLPFCTTGRGGCFQRRGIRMGRIHSIQQ